MDYSILSGDLDHKLNETADIEHYLTKYKDNMLTSTLSEHLTILLAQKKLNIADVVRGSLLERKYVYQIFSGRKKPSRDKLIAIAFGLCLSGNETQKMLKLSGNRELYVRDIRDSIILFSLRHGMTVMETNELLFDHDLAVLGTTFR